MSGHSNLLSAIRIFRSMDAVYWEAEKFVGSIELGKDTRVDLESDALLLTLFDQSGKELVPAHIRNLPDGTLIRVAVEAPISTTTAFVRNVDELLSRFSFRHTAPSAFFVADEDFLWEPGSEDVPLAISYYLDAIVLIDELQKMADHVDQQASSCNLVFLALGRKMVVPIDYTAEALSDVSPLIQAFAELTDAGPAEAYRTIFKNSLFNLLEAQPTERRLSYLIKNASFAAESYKRDAELFASGFSFETQLEAMLAQKRDYILQVNQTISDIQTKLLAIPISLVLVGGQMSPAVGREGCLANTAVLLGALVFAVLMGILAHVQWNSLTTINKELRSREKRWTNDYPLAAKDVKVAFRELHGRVTRVRVLQWVIVALVVLCVLFAGWLYLEHTPNPLSLCFPSSRIEFQFFAL